jgi:hypothetical protein
MGVMRIVVMEFPLDSTVPMSIETVKAVLADRPRTTAPRVTPPTAAQKTTPTPTPTAESKPAPPEPTEEAPIPTPKRRPPTAPPIGERGMDYAADAAFMPKEFKSTALRDKMLALGWTTQAKDPIKAVQSVLHRDMRFFYNVRKKVWTFREAAGAEKEGRG